MSTEAEDPSDPRVWESFFWGLLSAISLNIGSFIGVTCLPKKKVRAMLMSFGGGSLLFALSIELFGHVLSRSQERGESLPVWIMEGSAILGGILFALLNKALNAHGADVRKPSTTKGRFMRLRIALMRRLALRLWSIPFFAELSLDELKELIQSAMNKERYRTGDIIISHETRDSGIFFILSGMVRIYISEEEDALLPASPQALRELREVEPSAQSPVPARQLLPGAADLQKVRLPSPPRQLPIAPALTDLQKDAATERSSQLPGPGALSRMHCWDLGPDKIFGDMAVLTGTHLGVTAIALEGTKVLVLPCHEVMHLIDVNRQVRNHVALRALENMRQQLDSFRTVPESVLHTMVDLCRVETFQPGEVVFEGSVTLASPVMSLIFGEVEVTFHHDRSRATTVHGSSLLCTDHLRGYECQAFTAMAVEVTSVLIVAREDLDQATMHSWNDSDGTGSGAPTVVSVPSKTGQTSLNNGAKVNEVVPLAVHPATDNVIQTKGLGGRRESAGRDSSKRDSCKDTNLFWELPGQVGDEGSISAHTGPTQAWSVTASAQMSTPSLERLAQLGRRMGWEREDDPESDFLDPRIMLLEEGTPMEDISGMVTDQDLEEREQDIAELRAELMTAVRSGSKNSTKNDETTHPDEADGAEATVHAGGAGGAHAAIMVWLGILIDAIPESLVIGILINKAGTGGSSAEAALPFVIGVFLSNLPESMSSSGSMKAHGIQVRNILLMWWTITFLTAVGASIGALLFPPGSSDEPATEVIVSGVEGLAAGAMLTMIAQTMLPEAFEQGGDVVGLSCLAGFLCALSVKLIPFKDAGH